MAAAPLPPHDRYAFKVAVICALPLEAGMVQAVFDESWHDQSYRKALGDPNAYSLGLIGGHNVVLAHMSGMGNNNAATVAASMRSSFPGIEIAFVVGICGAVPRQDVVLGDCIISTQVIQYDFGKKYPHGFIKKDAVQDSLGRAPAHIRSFISMLSTPLNQERLTDRLTQHLETLQKGKDLHYPGWQRDRLFQPSYIHQHHDDTACDLCLDSIGICSKDCDVIKCEDDKLVQRKRRKAQSLVHFGRFGSANTVMKSGVDRDRIAAKDELIAFEMEGSGVWDVFPTIIVKSACDYADSHKSKEWQPYAAATAAAGLKAILEKYNVTEFIEHEKYKIQFSLQGLPVTKEFIARPAEMEHLQSLLPGHSDRRKVFILRGLGGIGKTQMAIEFMRTHHSRFSAVFWLDGSSEDNLKRSLASYSDKIMPDKASTQRDIDVVVEEVLGWLTLTDNSSWLLVFDNVDREFDSRKPDPDAYDLQRYFPSADRGSILITTRLARLQQLGESQEVEKVDNSTAQAILKSWYKKPYDEDDGKQLFELLDGLPLAIAQAGAYLQESGTNMKTYLRFYKETQRDITSMLDSHVYLQGYANRSVWTTWIISYEAIIKEDKYVANLLVLWSFLDRNDLWFGLFMDAVEREDLRVAFSQRVGEIATREESFLGAMHLLRRYSLVESSLDSDGYTMHAVVHRWTYAYQGLKHQQDLGLLALIMVGYTVPIHLDPRYASLERRVLPHAQTCVAKVLKKDAGYAPNFDLHTGWANQQAHVLDALQYLGLLYFYQNKHDEAERLLLQALQGSEKALGAKHENIFHAANNLGILYYTQHKFDEAERMFIRAMQGWEEMLGAWHEWTLGSINNLGFLFIQQDKLDEAEKMLLRALQGYKEALGDKDIKTLNVLNNLGQIRAKQGKFDEAEEMFRRALQGYEEATGVELVQTFIPALESMIDLGDLFLKMPSKITECRDLYTKVLSGYTLVRGASSNRCLYVQHRLSMLDAAARSKHMSPELSVNSEETDLVNGNEPKRRGTTFKGLIRKLKNLPVA